MTFQERELLRAISEWTNDAKVRYNLNMCETEWAFFDARQRERMALYSQFQDLSRQRRERFERNPFVRLMNLLDNGISFLWGKVFGRTS